MYIYFAWRSCCVRFSVFIPLPCIPTRLTGCWTTEAFVSPEPLFLGSHTYGLKGGREGDRRAVENSGHVLSLRRTPHTPAHSNTNHANTLLRPPFFHRTYSSVPALHYILSCSYTSFSTATLFPASHRALQRDHDTWDPRPLFCNVLLSLGHSLPVFSLEFDTEQV